MKKIFAALLAALLALSATACGTTPQATPEPAAPPQESPAAQPAEAPPSGSEVVITYPTYRVGSHLSAKAEQMIIDGFNQEYAGRIRVEVEELPSDQAYVEKMKVLASSKALPDIVEGKDGVLELAIRNGQAIDLAAYVNADATFKGEIGQAAIEANTVDGKLYSISNGNQLIGYFYNKQHFQTAGITPAKTWEEFMTNLDALKTAGITPISMMTGENCWTTNLLLAAMVGTANDTGNAFMKTKYPASYETPEMKNALEQVAKILTDYTTKDALGAKYDIAANHFLQANTAIVCNGPWMTGDFGNPEKAADGLDIGVALYPNDGVFAQFEIGYLVCSDTQEKQDAAFEFIKYKTGAASQLIMLQESGTIPLTGNVDIPQAYMDENPLIAELISLSGKAKYNFNTLDQISHSSVIDEMSKDYPSLSMGDIDVDTMLTYMSEAAAKSK